MSTETTIETVIAELQELGFSEGIENDIEAKEYDESASIEELKDLLINATATEDGSEEEEEGEEEVEQTKESVNEMKKPDLIKFIEKNNLDIDTSKNVKQIKKAVIELMFPNLDDDEEEVIKIKDETKEIKDGTAVKLKLISAIKKGGEVKKAGTILSTQYDDTAKRLIKIGVAEITK